MLYNEEIDHLVNGLFRPQIMAPRHFFLQLHVKPKFIMTLLQCPDPPLVGAGLCRLSQLGIGQPLNEDSHEPSKLDNR
jgi:hypothetical protein